MSNSVLQFSKALQNDGFEVQFELLPVIDIDEIQERKEILESLNSINAQQKILSQRIDALNTDIERLTNHADALDYSVAVGCGILCGLIDSFFVGEFDFDEALQKSKEQVNKYVESKAEKIRTSETVKKAIENAKRKAAEKGKKLSKEEIEEIKNKVTEGVANKFKKVISGDAENGTVNAIRRSITKLEEKYKLPSDHAHVGFKGMNSASHHLADLAHHASPLGLVAAIIGEVFRAGILVDKNGKWHIVYLGLGEDEKKRWLELVIPFVVSGIITWLLNLAVSKYKEEIDKNLPKPIAKVVHELANAPLAIAILNSVKNVFTNWWGHLSSDMAGSKSTPGGGMGIPGLFVSILKEISSIPIPPINKTKLPEIIEDIFVKYRFDMRAELAVINEMGKQSVPVIFGDILVRTFYFVRHLTVELSEKKDFKEVDWKKTIPMNNRTIVRMMTIESGTFTAIDIADAAIRSTIKNGTPENPLFWKDMILRVNFVGIGRFAIAVSSDVLMGREKATDINERMLLYGKYNLLENSKIFYKQENMWVTAIDTAKAMQHLQKTTYKTVCFYNDKINRLDLEWEKLCDNTTKVKSIDPEFAGELLDILDD